MITGDQQQNGQQVVAAAKFDFLRSKSMIDYQLDELLRNIERNNNQQPSTNEETLEQYHDHQTCHSKCGKIQDKLQLKSGRASPYSMPDSTSSSSGTDMLSTDSFDVSSLGSVLLSPTELLQGRGAEAASPPWPLTPGAGTDHPLPPCRICGDKASGFHYGANTCEACKGFFRRSLKRKRAYRQACSGTCKIGSSTRSGCAYCRYQKCMAAGMSKTAIKTGRYTHEKKARDIEEIKKHQTKLANPHYDESEEEINGNDQMMEDFIKKIVAANDKLACLLRVSLQDREKKIEEYMETRNITEEVFGQMAPLSLEQYTEIFQATGIDIDGRREMITTMFSKADTSIKRYIEFCKTLPRFNELVMEDQIALIKAGRWDFRLITMHKWIDTEAQVFLSVDMKTVMHRDDFVRLGPTWADIVDTVFKVAARIQKLRLHDIEIAFLKTIALFSRDRVNLCSPEKVEEIQSQCVEALLYHWNTNRPDRKHLLGDIFIILTDMRTVSHKQCEAEEGMTLELKNRFSLDISKIPPLLLEMMSS